jgi:hypothetical protein
MGLFIKADSENAKATYAALAAFGAPLQGMRGDQVTHLLDCQWRRSGIGRIEEVSQSSVPEEAWVGFADNLIEVRFSFPRLHLLVFE